MGPLLSMTHFKSSTHEGIWEMHTKIYSATPKEKIPLWRPRPMWKDNIKIDFKEVGLEHLDPSETRQCPLAGSYEHGNKSCESMNDRQFLDQPGFLRSLPHGVCVYEQVSPGSRSTSRPRPIKLLLVLARPVALGFGSHDQIFIVPRPWICLEIRSPLRREEVFVFLSRWHICCTVTEWVCWSGKLMMTCASTVILGALSRGTHDHILPSHDPGSPTVISVRRCIKCRV